jgi:hypothetical protein
MDERFIMHRYKATRFAMIVGVILIGALFLYARIARGIIRWDLFAVLVFTALAKVGAMIYYRRTN